MAETVLPEVPKVLPDDLEAAICRALGWHALQKHQGSLTLKVPPEMVGRFSYAITLQPDGSVRTTATLVQGE